MIDREFDAQDTFEEENQIVENELIQEPVYSNETPIEFPESEVLSGNSSAANNGSISFEENIEDTLY